MPQSDMESIANQTNTILALKEGVSKRPIQNVWINLPVQQDAHVRDWYEEQCRRDRIDNFLGSRW